MNSEAAITRIIYYATSDSPTFTHVMTTDSDSKEFDSCRVQKICRSTHQREKRPQ